MNEITYLEKRIENINKASDISKKSWVIYLSYTSYIYLANTNILNHTNSQIELPIIKININLTLFTILSIFIMGVMHFYVLLNHSLLAKLCKELNSDISRIKLNNDEVRNLLQLTHIYFFTQNILGYRNNEITKFGLRAMSWITLDLMPIWFILYLDITLQEFAIDNSINRIIMLLYLLMLFIMGVNRRVPEKSIIKGIIHYYTDWRAWALFTLIFLPGLIYSLTNYNIIKFVIALFYNK